VAARAYEAAKSGAWPADPAEGNRLFRAWLISMLATMANLGPRPTVIILEGNHDYDAIGAELGPGTRYAIDVRPSSRPDNFAWQEALATGLCGIVAAQLATPADPKGIGALRRMLIPDGQTVRIRTEDGAPPVVLGNAKPSDAGLGIVAGIVIVACVSAVAAAAAWVSSQIAEVTSVGLQQHGKTQQATAAMTKAAEIVEEHQAQEQKEGRELQYDAEQLRLLETLRETIKGTTGWTAPDLKSVPDIKGASDKIGTGLGFGQFFFGRCSALQRSRTQNSNGRKGDRSWPHLHIGEPQPAPGSKNHALGVRFSASADVRGSSLYRSSPAARRNSWDRWPARKSARLGRAGGVSLSRSAPRRFSPSAASPTWRTRSPGRPATRALSPTG
jgi:hypothetical protein